MTSLTAAALSLAAGLLPAATLPSGAGASGPETRPAQDARRLRGRVVLGPDSTPVSGVAVALHRIAGGSGAVVDRDTTDEDGRFRLRGAARPDSAGELYLAATRYEGVLYFGQVYRGGQRPPSPYRIRVFDTAPLLSPGSLAVSSRHLILRPAAEGEWSVTDLIEVRNEGGRTLVAPEGSREVWSAALPDRAYGASVSKSGVAAREVRIEGGRVRVASAVSPGTQRVALRYTIPAGEPVALSVRHPVERMEVLVQGQDRRLRSGRLAAEGPVRFEGDVYRRYTASGLAPGARVGFAVGGSAGDGLLAWLFLTAGVALLAAAVVLWVRQRRPPPGTPASTRAILVAAAGVAVSAGAAGAAHAATASIPTVSPTAPLPAPPDTIRIPDDRGDTLALAAPADRVVSLIPAATELLFAVGAGDRLVGRTRYGTHPPAAREVPSVGQGVRPSAEAVVARRPDVVVVYAGQGNRGSIRRFEALGVPVLALAHNTVPQLMDNIDRLGRLTGRGGAADSLKRSIGREMERVAELVGDRRPVRVYYDVWSDPPRTIGGGSYLDSLITLAGGRNVFGDMEGPSPQVSLEAVTERRPEVILFPRGEGGGDRPPPGERSGWRDLPAVRRGAVRSVDAELLHRLGPRLGEAAAHLAAVLHPSLSDSLRALGLLPPDSLRDLSSASPRSAPASATTCGAPSSGPGPGCRTTRTGHR